MKIKVERCWNGHSHSFRISTPGGRESIPCDDGDSWNRHYARKALDLLENVYGYNRSQIRFDVR